MIPNSFYPYSIEYRVVCIGVDIFEIVLRSFNSFTNSSHGGVVRIKFNDVLYKTFIDETNFLN